MDNVANSVANSTGDTVLDPTTLIHSYLAAQGLSPTSANVSRALMANASNPGTINGLVNQEPPAMDLEGQGRVPTKPAGKPVMANDQASFDVASTPATNTPASNPQTAATDGIDYSNALLSGAAGGGAALIARLVLNTLAGGPGIQGVNPQPLALPAPTPGIPAPAPQQALEAPPKQITADTPKVRGNPGNPDSGPTINLTGEQAPKPNAMDQFTAEGQAAMNEPAKPVTVEPTTAQGTARAARQLAKTDPAAAIEMFKTLEKEGGKSFAADIAKIMKLMKSR